MRLPVPDAPDVTTTGALWAVALAAAIFAATALLMVIWPPLALIPNVLLLLAAAYLIGGELWNRRYE